MALRFCLSKVPIYFRTGPQHPTPNIQHPTSNTQHPTPNIQHPTSNIQHPTPNIQRGRSQRRTSHSGGKQKAEKPGQATPEPPQGLLIANRLRPTSHPHATFMRPRSHLKAPTKPPFSLGTQRGGRRLHQGRGGLLTAHWHRCLAAVMASVNEIVTFPAGIG
jgi:hypothetical protein